MNGRESQKWAVTSNDPKDGSTTIWVDDKLYLLTKTQDSDVGAEMRNIAEGPRARASWTS